MFGQTDAESWRNNFEENLAKSQQKSKLRKISLVDCNKIATLFSTEEMMEFTNLVVSINEFTQDWEMFRLLTLVSLFSGDDLSTEAENFAAKLKEQYLTLLRRKAKSDKVYDQVCIGLKDVDKLSEILKKLDIKQVKSSS